MQKSFHQEWAFVQHFTPDIGMDFQAVEDELCYTFLPSLFQGSTSQIPRSAITGLPFIHNGISLPNPTQTVGTNWTASCMITGNLVAALRETAKLRSGNHALLMEEGR